MRCACVICEGVMCADVFIPDCNLTLHKQCHFKTDSLCPNTKVRTMNL